MAQMDMETIYYPQMAQMDADIFRRDGTTNDTNGNDLLSADGADGHGNDLLSADGADGRRFFLNWMEPRMTRMDINCDPQMAQMDADFFEQIGLDG